MRVAENQSPKKYRISAKERARRRRHMQAVRATQSVEQCIRGGKTRGDRHAAEGTGVCGLSEEERLKASAEGGRIGGPIAAAHPNSIAALAALCQDRQHQRYASHCSAHVRRGRIKVGCEFCEELISREAATE